MNKNYYVVDQLDKKVLIMSVNGEFMLVRGSEPYYKETSVLALEYFNRVISEGLKVSDVIKLPLKVVKLGGSY